MFSQLGPLFKTQLRLAEKSDARLEIRREERQDGGKKHEAPEEDESAGALWEDSTTVSIDALKAFLVGFLKDHGEKIPAAAIQSTSDPDAPVLQPEYRPPVNTRTARAVKAYSAMASHTATPPPPTKASGADGDNKEEQIDLVDLLAADELRTMHVLIAELEQLGRQGVQTLTIEKADSFLEALVMAVRAEKAKA